MPTGTARSKRTKKGAKQAKGLAKTFIDDEAEESDGQDDEETAGTLTPTEAELQEALLDNSDISDVNASSTAHQEHVATPPEPTKKRNEPDDGFKDTSIKGSHDSASKSSNIMESEAFKDFRANLKQSLEPARNFSAAVNDCVLNNKHSSRQASPDVQSSVQGEDAPNVSDKPKDDTVYLEDVNELPLAVPTDGCGVDDVGLQDPLLMSQYVGLPFLPGNCEIYGWSNAESLIQGWTQFSMWEKQNPNLNIPVAVDAIRFVRSGRYINPSRVAPLHLSTKIVMPGSETRRLHVSGGPAVCVSPIFSVDSFLIDGKEGVMPQKGLNGIFHSQEWQRFEAMMCLAFDHRRLKAQYHNHALDFCSRAKPQENSGAALKLNATAGMFGGSCTKAATSSNKGKARAISDTFKVVLDFYDHIPVFDARSATLNFDVDLPNLARRLPPFEGEIPAGSFTVVGYTVSVFINKNVPTLSCSIQWAIVCGTPV